MSFAIVFIVGIIIGYYPSHFRKNSLSKTSPPVLDKPPKIPARIVVLKSRVEELEEILNKENGK